MRVTSCVPLVKMPEQRLHDQASSVIASRMEVPAVYLGCSARLLSAKAAA